MESLTWHALSRPAKDEVVCGDSYSLQIIPGGFLAAIADGLGHGREAAQAAAMAIECIIQNPSEKLDLLAKQCHRALIGSRGAVLGLCRLKENQSMWEVLIIGNISIRILSDKKIRPIALRGILGYRFPPNLKVQQWPCRKNDVLIMHSDGIREDYSLDFYACNPKYPVNLLTNLMADTLGKQVDDTTIIIARPNREAVQCPN
ncbi:SpoIIE family protein phosphatase [Desulfolucanica intricata]|uniref:SpoIIE family protein phosphatase n=1 Tax=Desulfolucanica intricata TaxID=1285191 RepID=UPI00082ED7BB|nr:SpoIIE family protein phosphatase [Desulfolucanica intricata]